MNRRFRWLGRAARVIAAAAAIVTTTIAISALPADADDCPDGGVRLRCQPFDTAPRLAPVFGMSERCSAEDRLQSPGFYCHKL